jgi:hypothetical protein
LSNRYSDQIVKPTFLVEDALFRLNALMSVFKPMIYIKFILTCNLMQPQFLFYRFLVIVKQFSKGTNFYKRRKTFNNKRTVLYYPLLFNGMCFVLVGLYYTSTIENQKYEVFYLTVIATVRYVFSRTGV